MVQLLNIRKVPACLLPNIVRQLDCHMDATQFADCSTDLQSVLKAVLCFSHLGWELGWSWGKMKLPTWVSTKPLERLPFGLQQTPANFSDHFKPQGLTELKWKLYTQQHKEFCSVFSSRFWSEVLLDKCLYQMSLTFPIRNLRPEFPT